MEHVKVSESYGWFGRVMERLRRVLGSLGKFLERSISTEEFVRISRSTRALESFRAFGRVLVHLGEFKVAQPLFGTSDN